MTFPSRPMRTAALKVWSSHRSWHADDDMGADFRGCFANGFGCGTGYGFAHPGIAVLGTAEFSRDFGEAHKVGAIRGCFFEVAHHVFYVLFHVFVPTSGK